MAKSTSSWEDAYRNVESLWGLKPDRTLMEYANLVQGAKVFDLGIGEGRNALFFAKMGYEVEGIDVSQTAIERCLERAKSANLNVKAEVKDVKEYDIPSGRYSLVIASWVLNFFRKSEAEKIVKKIKNSLRKDGLVFVGMFSPEDPGYERASRELEAIEENTFYSSKRKGFFHYFTKKEVLSLFADFKVIYCVEGIALDTGHGEPHYHASIEYMGQKR